jgi:phosphoglycerol transferase MdoB-like AlkP superfamily enzyme
MQMIFSKIPRYIKALFLFMGISVLNLMLTKILFYIVNAASFIHLSILDVAVSIWFDIITVSLLFLVFAPFWLIPVQFRFSSVYKTIFRVLFLILNAFSIALNLMDVIYFEFTAKRSTIDLFAMLSYGKDLNQQWGSFFADFGWLCLVFILLIVLSDWLFRKVYKTFILPEPTSVKIQFICLGLVVFICVILGRGGVRLKPVSAINAAQYTRPENTAFILNTCFTMLKSFDHPSVEKKKYFSKQKLASIFSPIRKIHPNANFQLPKNSNVVIIILESFGDEWVGNKGYTPFLDSIFKKSYCFSNAFANGKKSIEGIPAILAGIPSLMDNPYISSNYSGNKIKGLGNYMHKHQYATYFFHGATNGSMNFDGFTALTGIQHYVGREEYNNEKDNDGTWGIYDHKFLPWAASQMSKIQQPFFSAIFTLSSHHPYKIPDDFVGKLNKGPVPLCQSIHYTDSAVHLFFKEAKKHDWYKNTLFVFVADHTSASKSKIYGQRIGMYQIPIAYFTPNGTLPARVDTRITQQIDIYPSIIDLLGWNETIYAIGSSVFDSTQCRFAVNYLGSTYQLFEENYVLNYTGTQQNFLYNFKKDPLMKKDSLQYLPKKSKKMEQLLKGIIQTYNNDLIYNRTLAK